MKKCFFVLFFLLFHLPCVSALFPDLDDPASVQAGDPLLICQNARQRALQQRGERIMAIRESIVKNTLRSYGGDYFKDGQNVAIMMNGKIYRDFTMEIIRGQYLLIRTPDGVFYFETVTNNP